MAENPDKFKVVALAAGSNITLLVEQVNFGFICLYIYLLNLDGFTPMANLLVTRIYS